MKKLESLLAELESYIPVIDRTNLAVSQASIGWHIEHSLLALIKSVSATENSNPADYKKKFSFKWVFVSITGKFPRGRVKAPQSVQPLGEISVEKLMPMFEKSRQKIAAFEKLERDKFFTHPVFGPLKHKQAGKVIAMHTVHHLRIIRDILHK